MDSTSQHIGEIHPRAQAASVNLDQWGPVSAALGRLGHVAGRGGCADDLTTEQIDVLIAELTRARNSRVDPGPGYQSVPASVTVVVQRGTDVTIAGVTTRLDRDELGGFARDFCDVALGVRTPDEV